MSEIKYERPANEAERIGRLQDNHQTLRLEIEKINRLISRQEAEFSKSSPLGVLAKFEKSINYCQTTIDVLRLSILRHSQQIYCESPKGIYQW